MSAARTDPAFTTPEEIRERHEAEAAMARRISAQLGRDYAERFGDSAGERVLSDLIARFAGQTYTRGDHLHTAFREGQRSVIEHIARAVGRAGQPMEEDNDYER